MLSRYFRLLETRPLQTKAVSAVFIFSTSDILAQAYEYRFENLSTLKKEESKLVSRFNGAGSNKNAKRLENETLCSNDGSLANFLETLDIFRTLKIAAFGCGITIWLHVWWGFLEVFVEKNIIKAAAAHYKNALIKVFLDQAIGAPIYNIAFFGSQALWGGKSIQQASNDIAERVPSTLKLHYCFWPWVHIVNFSFFPLHSRILVQNTLLIGWMSFLSHREQRFNKSKLEDEHIQATG